MSGVVSNQNEGAATTAPTYARLFPDVVDGRCSSDALEANTSPIAYLHALYHQAMAIEAQGNPDQAVTLAERRDDLGRMLLTPQALATRLPSLNLITRVLGKEATRRAGDSTTEQQLLIRPSARAGNPFNFAHEQIKSVLKLKRLHYFELLLQCEYTYPSFCFGRLTTEGIRVAMRKACQLSPELQNQLLQPSNVSAATVATRLGLVKEEAQYQNNDIWLSDFEATTGIGLAELNALLAIASTGPTYEILAYDIKRSAYLPAATADITNTTYGARFLYSHASAPLGYSLLNGKLRLTGHPSCVARIDPVIQLQRALQLPFAELDNLLVAINQAEGNKIRDNQITARTLRGLGVFRYLNAAYNVEAESFAALVHQINPYSTLDKTPMLDRVLNGSEDASSTSVPTPFIIDDRELELNAASPDSDSISIIGRLGKAFGVDEQTLRTQLVLVKQSLKVRKLKLSLPVLSALYRLSYIPRMLRRSQTEGAALMALLNQVNPAVLTQLAGVPTVHSFSAPDILDVLVALTSLDKWLRSHNLAPTAVLAALNPAHWQTVQLNAAQHQLLDESVGRLDSTCLTNAEIQKVVGNTFKVLAGDWLKQLPALMDSQGLVTAEGALDTALENALNGNFSTANGLDPDTRAALIKQLGALLENKRTAQQDVFNNMIISLAGKSPVAFSLEAAHVKPLLRWCGVERAAVLNKLLQAKKAGKLDPTALDTSWWQTIARHAFAVQLLRISPALLDTMCSAPKLFDFEEAPAAEEAEEESEVIKRGQLLVLDLDLCYQVSRFNDWVDVCRTNGFEASDALSYLLTPTFEDTKLDLKYATTRLGALLGWSEQEVVLAAPYVQVPAEATQDKTLDNYLATLSPTELNAFRTERNHLWLYKYWFKNSTNAHHLQIRSQLKAFLELSTGPLLMTQAQFDLYGNLSKEPSSARDDYDIKELDIEIRELSPSRTTSVAFAPSTITDIDYAMRLQAACRATGLSCQSLLDFSYLDFTSYRDYQHTADLLMAACTPTLGEAVNAEVGPSWRDALASYVSAVWHGVGGKLQEFTATPEAMSDFFLTDVFVGNGVMTTEVDQAIHSLQHYLHRLYAQLEPGYQDASLIESGNETWERYLSRYGTWKARQAQLNHPENLIYHANRPNKSVAFQELEVDLNQGKLDTDLLHTAICSYLNKFERISNLQVVSGYLDGSEPTTGMYHLIGKSNDTPPEYYWRTVDMAIRDEKGRLNPLAWGDWEKIAMPISGQVPQSTLREMCFENSGYVRRIIAHCDAIRPVIIAGRRYVFWVERGSTPLPSADEKNQTPTKFKKISVHYAYQQSDGFWSPANELISLDGRKDGKRLPDEDNPYLKDETYEPGLIVVVDVAGPRELDPWVTALLYNCNSGLGTVNVDYFIETRDLLFIEKKPEPSTPNFAETLYNSYSDVRNIQHPFDGLAHRLVESYRTIKKSTHADRDLYLTYPIDIKMRKKTERGSLALEFILECNTDNDWRIDENIAYLSFAGRAFIPGTQVITLIPEPINSRSACFEFTFEKNGTYIFQFQCQLSYEEEPTGFATGHNIYEYRFTYTSANTDEFWSVAIEKTTDQAQYIKLNTVTSDSGTTAAQYIRLNTLFGKHLVARASQSVERVLDFDSQLLEEPVIDSTTHRSGLDFHGGAGKNFRELFVDLPAMVATRLTEQQQFEDAETWYLRYLFNPYRTKPARDGRPALWGARPLSEVGTLSSTLLRQVDPTSRAFVLSRYYRQAIFLALVENWQRQGDHAYRQLTLSSLNQAWSCYQQATKLLGNLPEQAKASQWSPVALNALTEDYFNTPINDRVVQLLRTLRNRLFNLRHGLTLDGKLLPNLGWADEDIDPFTSAKGGLSIIRSSYNGDGSTVPAYRFRQLLPATRSAVQQLLDFGRHYMKLMEDEFNTSLSVQLKAQEIKLSDFTLQLKKEAISNVIAKKNTLLISKQAAEYRRDRFAKLIDDGRNTAEEAASALIWTAASLNTFAAPLKVVDGSMKTIPTIFGMAMGGSEMSGPVQAAISIVQGTATAFNFIADQMLLESGYDRRAADWEYEKTNAQWDIAIIDQQIAETNTELNAATASLDESRQERRNLEDAYVSMTTGFTIIPVYNWLVARQELLYGAAYDAVLSLCFSLESAWRYEIGDYQRPAFIRTQGWSDAYKGMLAGEALLNDLQEMENAYLLANERRLTIKKSFSLKTLLDDTAVTDWARKRANGDREPLVFEFKAKDFDCNYPGHYLRQLKHVCVSLVMNGSGNASEVSALLTQTGSTTVVEPDETALAYCYAAKGSTPGTVPKTVKRNLRANQQIALSSTLSEDGLGYAPGEWVYELMFHDGRYLPFEGTGAISQWRLEIPDDDFAKSLDGKLEDVRINLVYTAVDGGETFRESLLQRRNDTTSS